MSLRSFFSVIGRKPPPRPPDAWSVHATSNCKRHNHSEFQIRVSNGAVPAVDISWLLQHFEQRVAQGERFRSGESLQIGWMLTMLADGPGNLLRVLEPDMAAVPVKFFDSVDATLMHLRSQRDVVQSLPPPIEPEFPSLRQSVVVHLNYKKANRVLLTRSSAVNEADSGWWLTDLDDQDGSQDPTHFAKTSLYQLGIDRADLIKFFAVPVGLQVVVDGVRTACSGLLARWNRSQART
jgi:hypothetical protein